MLKELVSYFKEKTGFLTAQYKRQAVALVAFISAVFVLIIYFQTAPGPDAYAAAEQTFSKWESEEGDVAYMEMRKALKKVPSLERKYGPVIAQKLFQRNQLSDALELAHQSLKKIEEEAPFHADYGETTLLIERGFYQAALERSVGLKEVMLRQCDLERRVGDQPAVGSLLFAHNLLRIACLQKELKNKPGEKAAWEELETFLKEKESLTHLVFDNFRDKGLDLSHYISERRKQL